MKNFQINVHQSIPQLYNAKNAIIIMNSIILLAFLIFLKIAYNLVLVGIVKIALKDIIHITLHVKLFQNIVELTIQ